MPNPSTTITSRSNYRWYILTLAAITLAFVMAIQLNCVPVLFKEISDDLGLSLVQIGTAWGMVSMGGIIFALIGGLLSDRFGVKRVMSVGCFFTGLVGALRGISSDFTSLVVTMFLFGIPHAIISIIAFKPVSIWFSRQELGLANAILTLSVAVGLIVGAMTSATIISPLVGGWRNVLLLYGGVSIAIGIPWLLTHSGPSQVDSSDKHINTAPLYQTISHVARIKGVWLAGLIFISQCGCTHGMRGYLPLYLRDSGWTPANADGTLAAYGAASLVGVIPITLLSNKLSKRLGSRKPILFASMLTTAIGVSLLSVASGPMVWGGVIIGGLVWDGFMASLYSMVMETEGVEPAYFGTAMGLVYTIGRVGAIVSPIIGNSLATINPSLPFILWAALPFAVLVILCVYYLVKKISLRGAASRDLPYVQEEP